jgi:hypothetical protein
MNIDLFTKTIWLLQQPPTNGHYMYEIGKEAKGIRKEK